MLRQNLIDEETFDRWSFSRFFKKFHKNRKFVKCQFISSNKTHHQDISEELKNTVKIAIKLHTLVAPERNFIKVMGR